MADTRQKKSGAARSGGGRKRTVRKPARAATEDKEMVATAVTPEKATVDTGQSAARKGRDAKRAAGTPARAATEAKEMVATTVTPEGVSVETGKSGENGVDPVPSRAQRSETLIEVCLSIPRFRSRIISHLLRRLR